VTALWLEESDGTYSKAPDKLVIEVAVAAVHRAFKRGPSFQSPAQARRLLPALLGTMEYEVFCVAHLDQRHKLIQFEQLFRGAVDACSVHPRELVRSVMRWNSAAIVLVHNHPSGESAPSQADELITRRIKDAMAMIDVRVVDHLIVGSGDVYSMAEHGLM
jgi:DNA repair protein RadC